MSELLRRISGGIGTRRALTIPELEGAKAALELRVEELELEVSELTTENKALKQLFLDLYFCYLNKEFTATLCNDTLKEFSEIVGDDAEYVITARVRDKIGDGNE